MKSVPKSIYLIALLGTFLCVFINELNADYLKVDLKNQFGMVQTADETSYIVPPKNFVHTGEWRDNSNGLTAFYQRPPGYGIIYLTAYYVLGDEALLGVKIIQITLFFLSILMFWRLGKAMGLSQKMLLAVTLLFAFLPSYSGFVYYSMTEGVTPFFVLWSVLSMLSVAKNNQSFWELVVSTIFLLLIRPQLAIIPISMLIYFAVRKKFKPMLFLGLSFLPIFAWYVRTAVISQEIPSLHPIYSKTNNHIYRPSHEALTDLFRVWEWRSDVFHNQTGRIAFGDSTTILAVANELPEAYRSKVTPLLFEFRDLNVYRETELKNQQLRDYIPNELSFLKHVKIAKNELISQNLTDYYLKTPFLSLIEFLNKSYLNLYLFQEPLRGNWLMEALRVSCWLVFIVSFICTFLLLFKTKWSSVIVCFVLALGIFMFYLAFIQRLNEERYIVPIMPLFLVFGAFFLDTILSKKKLIV